MNTELRNDAYTIIQSAIQAVLPDAAVRRALKQFRPGAGRTVLVAIGKAAWQMASSAIESMPDLTEGIVITKYGHVKSSLPGITCYEAGHPVPDENGFLATEKVLSMVNLLGKEDTVLFLVSGGGSALFESPLVSAEELQDITKQLLACGADIIEMNTIRKRLSKVKGGKFAQMAAPAKVFTIVLSDIIGDPLDMIASGPAYPDTSSCAQALEIVKHYNLKMSEKAMALLLLETPKSLDNVETYVTGSVKELCLAAEQACRELEYDPVILTDELSCEASEAGRYLAGIIRSHAGEGKKLAFIAGGETVVHLKGDGRGGRNQELALAAAEGIAGLENTAVFSVGSDGTDGPTDAAGGYADGDTRKELAENGFQIYEVLAKNDAYHALASIGNLIITGPTGTNVNDVAVCLIR